MQRRAVVDEFPELIYRIHAYDYVESLPISIQNMLLDFSSEDETRLEDYERAWDECEKPPPARMISSPTTPPNG